MGYPMTWKRLVARNGLDGDYDPALNPKALISGDMRRLVDDSVDGDHIAKEIERRTDIKVETVVEVLATWFEV